MVNKLPGKLEKPFILEFTILSLTAAWEKCTSRKYSTTFLDQMDLPTNLTEWETQTAHKVAFILLFKAIGLPEQCGWQIK